MKYPSVVADPDLESAPELFFYLWLLLFFYYKVELSKYSVPTFLSSYMTSLSLFVRFHTAPFFWEYNANFAGPDNPDTTVTFL